MVIRFDGSSPSPTSWPGGRYGSVRTVLQNPVAWSSANSVFGDAYRHPEFPAVITLDGDDHRRIRSVLAPLLDRQGVEALRRRLAPIARRTVEDALRRARFDAVVDVARPVASASVEALLGARVPSEYLGATAAVAAAMGAQANLVGTPRLEAYEAALGELHALFLDWLRRPPSREGAAGLFASAVRAHRITVREAVANLVLLSIAGSETTIGLLAGVIVRLAAAHPLHERLRRQRVARVRFIEEGA
ncbi:MAG: hypothetical protein U0360_11640, partial [Dehalococcoidia bacterium]